MRKLGRVMPGEGLHRASIPLPEQWGIAYALPSGVKTCPDPTSHSGKTAT